uniref:Uncharacterized protein n=1 Tax=Phaseolus vulgaris TaxID=3885 RepID=V7ASA4_PHAVU|nr:hypothetical protein PHAVU_009G054100g [Phaseolus vulgaris]ESW08542.1 hypothetical protein PHAVU_009G054100g [Phaseolus vulgaris]
MDSSPSQGICIPEQWSEAADSNCLQQLFSRYLLNILLHKYAEVAYFDTDVGQPEFTPPAFLSLTVVHKVTPDLTVPCLKTPERCLFFGDVSSKRDPSTYLSYVFAISDYYQKEYCISEKGEILVMSSVGYDVLVDMLKYISPTHVVKINISSENKNLPAGEFWLDEECDGTINLIEINSARQDSSNRYCLFGPFITIFMFQVTYNILVCFPRVLFQKDARPLRDLRIMAYFRQCFSSDSNLSTIKELAHALTSHCPYEVPIASVKIRLLHCEVPSSEMFFSLNATIVGLAVDSEEPENLPWCFGLGIVRGIDTVKGVLYVITPVPHSSLEKVNLLLQGYIQIPSCLLQARLFLVSTNKVVAMSVLKDNHVSCGLGRPKGILQVQGYISPYMSANTLAITSY